MTLAKFYELVLTDLYGRLFEQYHISDIHLAPSVCLSMAKVLEYRPNLGEFSVPKDLEKDEQVETLYEIVNVPLEAAKKVSFETIIHYSAMTATVEAGLVILRLKTDEFCEELTKMAAEAKQNVREYKQSMELLMSEKAAEC